MRTHTFSSRGFSVSAGRKKTLTSVTRSRLHRSAKRATAVIPLHYRRICANGILIERCLLSLNAMARVTAGALRTRHGRYILQTNSTRACATGARVKLVIQCRSPRRALIIVRSAYLKQRLLTALIRGISMNKKVKF